MGDALLQEALKNMQAIYKAKECYLEVRVSNMPAIKLYRKIGFYIKRTLHDYYSDNESAYMMTKKFNTP
jgi:ribosomal-protein-alanine N-acetyltransferase